MIWGRVGLPGFFPQVFVKPFFQVGVQRESGRGVGNVELTSSVTGSSMYRVICVATFFTHFRKNSRTFSERY
jgi:hypothetical protein